MADINPAVLGAAAISHRERTLASKCVRFFTYTVPLFVYILLAYVLVELNVPDMRAVFVSVGTYSLSAVEVLYLFGTLFAMVELLRVSRPGIDNTKEALLMLAVAIAMLIFFVLSAAGVSVFSVFSTTEFLVLLLIATMQVGMAFVINARTLKRTIDHSQTEY